MFKSPNDKNHIAEENKQTNKQKNAQPKTPEFHVKLKNKAYAQHSDIEIQRDCVHIDKNKTH